MLRIWVSGAGEEGCFGVMVWRMVAYGKPEALADPCLHRFTRK
jgi:predicted metal-binding transcription factor (methanogenesis marker protein 9)